MKKVICLFSIFWLFCLGKLVYAEKIFTLKEVVARVLTSNPAIQAVSQVEKEYKAQKKLVRAKFFPQIIVEYSFQRLREHKIQPIQEVNSFGAEVKWNLFSGFSDYHLYKETEELIKLARVQKTASRLDKAFEAVKAYLDYLKEEAYYLAAKKDVEDAETILNFAQERYKLGLCAYADVLDARARLEEARTYLETHKVLSDIYKGQVLTLMGLEPREFKEVKLLPLPPQKISPPPLNICFKLALRRSPLLKAKTQEIKAQEEELKKVKGEYLPSIDFFASYYKMDRKFFPEEDKQFTVGVQLSWPIFTGFSTPSKIEKTQAKLERLRLEKQNLTLQLKQGVLSAYKSWKSAEQSHRAAMEWLKSVEEDYKIIKEKYQEGLASIVDLTTVMSKLSQARAKEVASRYSLLLNYYQLIKTMGFIPGIETPSI